MCGILDLFQIKVMTLLILSEKAKQKYLSLVVHIYEMFPNVCFPAQLLLLLYCGLRSSSFGHSLECSAFPIAPIANLFWHNFHKSPTISLAASGMLSTQVRCIFQGQCQSKSNPKWAAAFQPDCSAEKCLRQQGL